MTHTMMIHLLSDQDGLQCLTLHIDQPEDLLEVLQVETFRAPDMRYVYSQPSSVFSYGVDYPQCYANYLAGTTATAPMILKI